MESPSSGSACPISTMRDVAEPASGVTIASGSLREGARKPRGVAARLSLRRRNRELVQSFQDVVASTSPAVRRPNLECPSGSGTMGEPAVFGAVH
jgi:hypothetical protein